MCGRANCTSQDYSGPEKVIPQGLHDSGHATAQGEGGGRRKHRDRPEATKHIGGPDHTK